MQEIGNRRQQKLAKEQNSEERRKEGIAEKEKAEKSEGKMSTYE